MVDIYHKSQLLNMDFYPNCGIEVSKSWVDETIEKHHQWLLDNPEEYFLYTTTGNVFICSHRGKTDKLISTYITQVKAYGCQYVNENQSEILKVQKFTRDIEIE